jgi:hypothetical protein
MRLPTRAARQLPDQSTTLRARPPGAEMGSDAAYQRIGRRRAVTLATSAEEFV